MLVRHGGHVDQQPGVLQAQLDLGGMKVMDGRAQGHPAIAGSALSSGYACREAARSGDTVTVGRILLDGLARDADIFELLSELAPLHP